MAGTSVEKVQTWLTITRRINIAAVWCTATKESARTVLTTQHITSGFRRARQVEGRNTAILCMNVSVEF